MHFVKIRIATRFDVLTAWPELVVFAYGNLLSIWNLCPADWLFKVECGSCIYRNSNCAAGTDKVRRSPSVLFSSVFRFCMPICSDYRLCLCALAVL